MFREIILSIFRSTRLCVTACGIIHPRCCRPATSWVHYTKSCNTHSSAPEDGQNNFPKHVELTGIINKPLLLHLVDCLYFLHQWCTVNQISDNEIYLLIKYTKSVLWRAAKRQSYIEDALCLKVKKPFPLLQLVTLRHFSEVLAIRDVIMHVFWYAVSGRLVNNYVRTRRNIPEDLNFR